jgi:hypothetical protein
MAGTRMASGFQAEQHKKGDFCTMLVTFRFFTQFAPSPTAHGQ